MAPFLYPVIRVSTDLKESCSVYLMEDALELWLTVLHNTKTMSSQLFELTENIVPLLGKDGGFVNAKGMSYELTRLDKPIL